MSWLATAMRRFNTVLLIASCLPVLCVHDSWAQDRVPDTPERARWLDSSKVQATSIPVAKHVQDALHVIHLHPLHAQSKTEDLPEVTPSEPLKPAPVTEIAPDLNIRPLQTEIPADFSVREVPGLLERHAVGQTARISSVWTLAVEDERIDVALMRWSREAGYGFRWDAERLFPIAASTRFEGSYEDALVSLLTSPGILNSNYPLEACIYNNVPPLVRITRMGDQTQECR